MGRPIFGGQCPNKEGRVHRNNFRGKYLFKFLGLGSSKKSFRHIFQNWATDVLRVND